MLRTLLTSRVAAATAVCHPAFAVRCYSSKPSFMKSAPGPPKLDKKDQEEFEDLIHKANTQMIIEEHNEKIQAESGEGAPKPSDAPRVDVGSFSPELFQIIPEFEGDVNPKTGERGGPKQDPLKHKNDWSFNGRVTDF